MQTDDLSAPLGKNPPKKHAVLPALAAWTTVALLLLSTLVFVGWAAIVKDPFGGEPVVIVSAEAPHPAGEATGKSAPSEESPAPRSDDKDAKPSASPASGDPVRTVTIIDGSSGKRQEVPIPPAERNPNADALVELSRHGPIPRIGKDGERPAQAHAQKADALAKTDMPRVALIVGGLGVGAATTSEALAKLPGAVTLAFLPYGANLDPVVSRARGEGHEILLQVPMEPLDYPDNDPGPQTLLTSLSVDQNIDRLHWIMSRFRSYVGIAGFMGSRFTATDGALAPILREAAKRGLLYLEDGASARSLAGQIAGANSMSFAKADVTIDSVPTATEIDRALTRLEQVARDRGVAIGMASALPISIERIAAWSKSAAQRGVVLVPLTAIALKPKST